jgi:hypothetical protein
VALEQQVVWCFLHQPIDALGVDRGKAVGSPFALDKRQCLEIAGSVPDRQLRL